MAAPYVETAGEDQARCQGAGRPVRQPDNPVGSVSKYIPSEGYATPLASDGGGML